MNREFLKEQGLNDEQIEAVMKEHGKTVNSTKEELETVTTERDNLKEQLDDRDTQLANLKKEVKDNEELTNRITDLENENKEQKEQFETKLKDNAITNAIKLALAGKVHDEELAASLIDKEKLVIDGDKIVGLDEQVEGLKESKSFLFKEEEPNNDPKPNFTLGNHQKGSGTITSDDFKKMSYKERLKLKQENPDQYNSLVGK